MWGDRTAMEQFLQDQGITTLFFGGVNTDQCVYGTLLVSIVSLIPHAIVFADCCVGLRL